MKVIDNKLLSKKRKNERLKIRRLTDFQDALNKEGYILDINNKEKLRREVELNFKIDNVVVNALIHELLKEEITYRADDIKDFTHYIEKIILYENRFNKLRDRLREIKIITIDRVEYERIFSKEDDVESLIKVVEKLSKEISKVIEEEDKHLLIELEEEIDRGYVYAKDIELLKKIITIDNSSIEDEYNLEKRVRTLRIEIPKELSNNHIKAKKGSVEYHNYLNNSIPRMERLIRSMDKYLLEDDINDKAFRIDQSKAIQDSINMAVAIFNGKKFKAISGSDEIENFCEALPEGETSFTSRRVNKLGRLGVGYDRSKDSEKKIFEEVHRQIKRNVLKDQGELILYSKWEPCPSCYLVIKQFNEEHPNIKVSVRYMKSYGEN